MPTNILFWVIFIIDLIFTVVVSLRVAAAFRYGSLASRVLDLALIALLGWKMFGPVLQ